MEKLGEYGLTAYSFAVDCTGHLSMPALGNVLLHCAGLHANARGFGRKVCNEGEFGWVLSRLAIEVGHMPREYELYKVRTWVERVYGHFTDRNFELVDAQGQVFGYARSVWAMLDLKRRCSVDLAALHGTDITSYVDADRPCPMSHCAKVRVKAAQPCRQLPVVCADIDVNLHVNSMRYIEHIIDLFSLDFLVAHPLRRIDLAYMAEAHYGDVLSFYLDENAPLTYSVGVSSEAHPLLRAQLLFA